MRCGCGEYMACGWYTWFRYCVWSRRHGVDVGGEELVEYVRCVCVGLGAAWVESW